MVGGIVASGNRECVRRTLGCRHLHLLLVLQVYRRTLLTGQLQTVERHMGLAGGLQNQLSVVAFSLQTQGQLVLFVLALDTYAGTVSTYRHTVLYFLCHLRRRTVIADGDVLSLAYAAHQQGQCT